MSDPKRLLEGGTELEMAVLGSARGDTPPRDLDRRVYAALGVGAAAVGLGMAPTTTAAAAKGAPLLLSGVSGLAKWIAIALLGGVAVVGAATAAHVRSASRPALIAPSSGAATAAETVARYGGGLGPALSSPAVVAPPPSANPDVPSGAPSPSKPAAPVVVPSPMPSPVALAAPAASARPDDLAEELSVLERARGALDAKDSARTIAELDRHDLAYPHGGLAAEALALRIEAYAQRGDDARVTELAGRFLSAYPSHPYARHLGSRVVAH